MLTFLLSLSIAHAVEGYRDALWGMSPEDVIAAQGEAHFEELDLFDWKRDLNRQERKSYRARSSKGERRAHHQKGRMTVWQDMHCLPGRQAYAGRKDSRVLVVTTSPTEDKASNWNWYYQHHTTVAGQQGILVYCFTRNAKTEDFELDRVYIDFFSMTGDEQKKIVNALVDKYGRPEAYADQQTRSWTSTDVDFTNIYDSDYNVVATVTNTEAGCRLSMCLRPTTTISYPLRPDRRSSPPAARHSGGPGRGA